MAKTVIEDDTADLTRPDDCREPLKDLGVTTISMRNTGALTTNRLMPSESRASSSFRYS
jgi:hypothetical protein